MHSHTPACTAACQSEPVALAEIRAVLATLYLYLPRTCQRGKKKYLDAANKETSRSSGFSSVYDAIGQQVHCDLPLTCL